MGKVEIKQALAVLFASFYVFNVHYPAGCSNFYLLLESLLFKKKLIGRKPRLAAVLAELYQPRFFCINYNYNIHCSIVSYRSLHNNIYYTKILISCNVLIFFFH